jgi:hypothetical protein
VESAAQVDSREVDVDVDVDVDVEEPSLERLG